MRSMAVRRCAVAMLMQLLVDARRMLRWCVYASFREGHGMSMSHADNDIPVMRIRND